MKKMVFHEHIDWKCESMLYMEIGKRIREARVRKGFTQEELSARVKLSRPSISYLEKQEIVYFLESDSNKTLHRMIRQLAIHDTG